MQRPDKLRVITPGDGPPSEFYYDGKTMMAFSPAENLVAVADAPPTIDAALKAAFHVAPRSTFRSPTCRRRSVQGHRGRADRWPSTSASRSVVGGTTTDMVAFANDDVFVQVWIGVKDKLPRLVRAIYRNDPAQLRHQMDLSNWRLDSPIPAGTFTRRAPPPRSASLSPGRSPEPAAGRRQPLLPPPTKTRRHRMTEGEQIMKRNRSSLAWQDCWSRRSRASQPWHGRTQNRWGGDTSHAGRVGVARPGATGVGRQRDAHLRARHDRDRPLWRHRDARRGVRLHERHQSVWWQRDTHVAGRARPRPARTAARRRTILGRATTRARTSTAAARRTTYGEGTSYTSASGATAYHSPYYGGYYGGYHPPSPPTTRRITLRPP